MISCEKIERIELPGQKFEIIKLLNLEVKQSNNQRNIRYVPGKSYIFHFDKYFYHQIQEIAAQFDLLKAFMPDIKVFFFDRYSIIQGDVNNIKFFDALNNYSFHQNSSFSKNKNSHRYFEDLHKLYLKDSSDKNVYSLISANFIFEEVCMITDVVNFIPSEVFEKHGVEPVWLDEKFLNNPYEFYDLINPTSISLYKERALQYVIKNDKLPSKIYISRADANKRYEEDIKTLDPDFWEDQLKFVGKRYFPNDVFIEDYFKERGFVSLSLEGMSYIEQLNYFYNATHIAGTIGSGFTNILISPADTKIFEIHVLPDYSFGYKYLSEIMGHQHYKIDLKSVSHSPQEMFNMLNYYGHEY